MANDTGQRYNRRSVLKYGGTALGLSALAGCTGGGQNAGSGSQSTPEPTPATATPTQGAATTTTLSEKAKLMKQANPPKTITVTLFPVQAMFPIVYAKAKGLFKANGLNVQFTDKPIFGGSRNAAALLAGKADVAGIIANPGAINLARAQGRYLKMIYPEGSVDIGNDQTLGSALIANTKYQTIHDLQGKSVAIMAGEPGVLLASTKWLLDQAGMDPESAVDFRHIPLPQIVGAVAQDSVAGGSGLAPRVIQGKEKGLPIHRLAWNFEWLGKGTAVSTWTTSEFATNHPATVKLFQMTMQEANAMVKSNTEEFATIIGKSPLHFDKALVMKMYNKGFFGTLPASVQAAQPIQSLQKIQSLLNKYVPDISGTIDVSKLVLPWDQP